MSFDHVCKRNIEATRLQCNIEFWSLRIDASFKAILSCYLVLKLQGSVEMLEKLVRGLEIQEAPSCRVFFIFSFGANAVEWSTFSSPTTS
ncbi:hypothetical protein TNCT_630341 [Trichonephila clavata]|uniref:Uncharacterized protein n=1 Tax=Trichonephila clavata TaxID=2740835 RepID=A0A8X6H2R2_TRICU|nr:hypothetical protein TNCT_630341 [Trichonephila clavata]